MTLSLPDPRTNPYRPDLAAAHLEGIVQAERFIEGVPCQLCAGFATVKAAPDFEARQTTQALFGETVTVYEEHDGWVWGQIETDGYVGYLRLETLSGETPEPTHRVAALRTFLFPEPDLKSPTLDVLSLTSRVAVIGETNGFAELEQGGWVFAKHLAGLAEVTPDYVGTASRLIGVPYLWGGKTSFGLDCSALVQLSLNACGAPCWRDSDMQELSYPRIEPADDLSDLQRGDLIFWEGHVAIVRDGSTVIHANGYHMAVAIEPIADAVARNRADGIALSSVRRLEGSMRGDQ